MAKDNSKKLFVTKKMSIPFERKKAKLIDHDGWK
jgi:hypothetical protein